MLTSRQIIEKAGGVRNVAALLGEDWKTVHNWTRPGRRIPSRQWPALSRTTGVEIVELEVHVAVVQDAEHAA